jgi:uncharacterized RDD family membrane protein YckC
VTPVTTLGPERSPAPPVGGIITPEAVVLDLPAAGVASRLVAKLVDLGLQAQFLLVSMTGLTLVAGLGPADALPPVVEVANWILVFVALFVLPIASELLWHGQTPGKALLGLRAVNADGGPINGRQAVVRGLFQLIDVYLLVGIVPALATRRARRFGDLVAGTFVLTQRASGTDAVPVAFGVPPGQEAYVRSLDVGRLDERQYRLVRSYLLRVAGLDPGARFHLGVAIADRVARRVSPQPPPMSPQVFLQCVLAARQRRADGAMALDR